MRKARVLFFLLCLVAGAYAALFGLQNGWFEQQTVEDQQEIAQPVAPGRSGPGTQEPGPSKDQTGDITRPIFDVVRAEPTGEMLLAGQAEPGWTVTVQSSGQTIGSAVADANGNWIIQPDKPVSRGEHSLELRAREPEGSRTMFSKQRLALSLSENATNQPLVALTEEGKATKVLQRPLQGPTANYGRAEQMAKADGAATGNIQADGLRLPGKSVEEVSFISIDYEELGEKSVIHLNGYGTPGSPIRLFMDNELIGTTKADATGSWTFSANRELTGATYRLRADLTEVDSETVRARAEVKFDRKPSAEIAQLDEDEKARAWRQWDKNADSQGNSLAGISADDAINPENVAGRVIVVRSGDTLWQIAERYYGNGRKFTQIFRNNRDQIRNPNLIYPSQRFTLPE